MAEEKDSELQRYLNLACKQVQHRVKTLDAKANPQVREKLKILEEIIMEQIPNENTRRSVGSAR